MRISKIIAFLFSLYCFNSLNAQADPFKNKGSLEFGLGINMFGPGPQMAKLMDKHNFNRDSQNWLFGGTLEHPDYAATGHSINISYSRNLSLKSQLGILLQYSMLRKVLGYSSLGGYLKVLFSSTYIVPRYTLELSQFWEIQVGPALVINSAKPEYVEYANNETKLSPGLLAGMNFKIWDGTHTSGKISTSYLLTTRNIIGPYTDEAWSGGATVTIPESKIGFGHLNLLFVIGIHL